MSIASLNHIMNDWKNSNDVVVMDGGRIGFFALKSGFLAKELSFLSANSFSFTVKQIKMSHVFLTLFCLCWCFVAFPQTDPEVVCVPPFDVSTAVHADSDLDVTTWQTDLTGIAFNPDGTKMFVIGWGNDHVVEYDLPIPFDVSEAVYASSDLNVSGQDSTPSGLAFNNDGTKLFVIGNTGDRIYEYDMPIPYDVSEAVYTGNSEWLYVGGQETNPQGLTFNDDGTKLFVIGRQRDSVLEYNLPIPFDVSEAVFAGYDEDFTVNAQEQSPHDLAFNNDGTKLYVLGNDDPSNAVVEYDLPIPYDVSEAVYAGLEEEFSVSDETTSPLGFAFDADGSKMFVVGWDDRVIEYTLESTSNYQENPVSNDGSIAMSAEPLMYIALHDTFVDTNNDDVLDGGITITNLPEGLTAVWSLSDDDTVATLSFTGKATYHLKDSNDIDALNVIVSSSATTSGAAAFNCNSDIVGINFIINDIRPETLMRHGKNFIGGRERSMTF